MINMLTFKNPDALYRNAPFWSWNDKLNAEELKRQIDEMADKGWGSYFMHSRVGLVTGYLSDEWMELIKACAKKAGETQTFAWIYDEDKWPSGYAGGEVPEMDEKYRSRALVLLKKEEITPDDMVLEEVEYEGTTHCICKRVSSFGNDWFNGACYVDLMNPEAVKAFIDCTHERYKKSCGEYFGKEIPGIFTDEPCYLMAGHYSVPVVPWSDYLPDFFLKLKGYSIINHIRELFFEVDDYRKIRFDFYDCATRLFRESFTKQYYQWCDKNNLIMTGHFMAEDDQVYQTQWIGAAMPHYEFMHWPGIDKLARHIEQHVTVKQVSSAADQLGKERAFSEVFGCVGQHVSFYHRKWIGDWQAALGISFVNSHLSLYSMRGERKRDFPANLFYQQPWWENERKYADYTGRLCYAVSQGKRDVNILLLHSITSTWCEYSPLHKKNGFAVENSAYNNPFEELAYKLTANKLDFHFGDEMLMENHAKIQGNKLVIGEHEYSTIIVPPSLNIRKSTAKLLSDFAREAGAKRVIFVEKLPELVDGQKTGIFIPEGTVIAESQNEAINVLDSYYPERIGIIDTNTGNNAEKLICHTRIDGSTKLIFIANTDEEKGADVHISLPGNTAPYLLDLMTGNVYKTDAKIHNGRAYIDMKFYPAGSILLYYPGKEIDASEPPVFLDSGVELGSIPQSTYMIDSFSIKPLEANVLPLHDVTLFVNGKKVVEEGHISQVWHDHFYKLPDGTPFKAEYNFEVKEVPEGEIFAAIECAENLNSIKLNGKPLKALKNKGEPETFDPSKSWKDLSFTKVPLDGLLVSGDNKLVIEGIKVNNITNPGCHIRVKDYNGHMPTEVETVYIVGDFSVINEDNNRFMIGSKKAISGCADITPCGYPFYSGKLEYTADFEYMDTKDKVYLKIGKVNAACLELYVNGKYIDTKYWNPYIFDITDVIEEGRNSISIVAATTLFNLMGPNWIKGIPEKKWVAPDTFIDMDNFTKEYTLLPFGIGNVSILE